MENITNELRARIFGAYMPCEMKDRHTNRIYKILGVSIDECMLQVDGGYENFWWSITDAYQLLITPLSEITDEDAIEVAKIIFGKSFPDKVIGDSYEFAISYGKRVVLDFMHTSYTVSKCIQISDYLRSKSYDLGYAHIPSLIEAGIAIAKTN